MNRKWKVDLQVGILALALALGLATGGVAQPVTGPLNYNVRTMNFELWCQDTQHRPPERCEARRLDDIAAFESYRRLIERYELAYLKRVQKDQIERTFTNHDPSQTVLDKAHALPWALSQH
jgi:hypothetical protein